MTLDSAVGDLGDRLEALQRILEIAPAQLNPDLVTGSSELLERSKERLRHGTSHTVAAIAGSTGAGKSTLLNALAGAEIATTGVRRPTTSQAQAVVWGDGADALLDWLLISKRHHVSAGARDGLVLLDLPDHDSIEAGNRAEVDRLVKLVDLFVWVADPQKYADDSLHTGYLKRLATHGDVMVFVLSKTDTVTPDEAERCLADFKRLIVADGIAEPSMVGVSAQSGEGVAQLQAALDGAVQAKAAIVRRIDADLRQVAVELTTSDGPKSKINKAAKADLVESLTRAADADAAAVAIGAHHQHVGRVALGWPPTRWLRRFRKSPISTLPTRSNSPTMAPQVHSALRDYGESQGVDVPGPWRASVRLASTDQAEPVIELLDRAGATALRSSTARPRWWAAGAGLQWLCAGAATLGLVWLTALLLVDGFLRIDIGSITPDYRGTPVPTWLLLGGLVAGFVATWLLRVPLAAGASRRKRQARLEVAEGVEAIVADAVVPPVQQRRSEAAEYEVLVQRLVESSS